MEFMLMAGNGVSLRFYDTSQWGLRPAPRTWILLASASLPTTLWSFAAKQTAVTSARKPMSMIASYRVLTPSVSFLQYLLISLRNQDRRQYNNFLSLNVALEVIGGKNPFLISVPVQ